MNQANFGNVEKVQKLLGERFSNEEERKMLVTGGWKPRLPMQIPIPLWFSLLKRRSFELATDRAKKLEVQKTKANLLIFPVWYISTSALEADDWELQLLLIDKQSAYYNLLEAFEPVIIRAEADFYTVPVIVPTGMSNWTDPRLRVIANYGNYGVSTNKKLIVTEIKLVKQVKVKSRPQEKITAVSARLILASDEWKFEPDELEKINQIASEIL